MSTHKCSSCYFALLFVCFFFGRYPLSSMTFKNCRRTLYRYRARNLPTNVQNVAEVLAAYERPEMSKFALTNSKQPFFKKAYACGEFEYCIFASDFVIAQIKERIPEDIRNILMDATFQICPYGVFKQLLIIHVCYLEKVK